MDNLIYKSCTSEISLVGDGTCIKRAKLPEHFRKIDNEARCLQILDGSIAPKLIGYDSVEHELRMEYIQGLTLSQYIIKHGEIPRYFFASVASNLLELLKRGIEYGGDENGEHFIIIEGEKNVRIIDFDESQILEKSEDIKDKEKYYKRKFAFVFKDAKRIDIDNSKKEIRNILCPNSIHPNLLVEILNKIIDKYFEDYDII